MKIKAGASHFSMALVLILANAKNEENTANIARLNVKSKNAHLNGKVD